MNNEEIDYWLRYFSNHNHGFMSEDGKKITLFKVFQELKELQRLLKIQNDYITNLQQENKTLKDRIDKAIEYIESNDIEVLKYYDIPSETTSYEIVTVDLLKILRGGENE